MIKIVYLNHNKNMKVIKKYNLFLFIPLLIINIISIFNMYNARYINSVYNNALIKQSIWFLLGYLIIIILQKIKVKKIFKYAKPLYILSNILLILVLFLGSSTNGAKCWLNIFGFTFQPSELAKISLSLYLVDIVSNVKIKSWKDELKIIFKLGIITLIPSLLVFLEPDTGAIINFLIIFLITISFLKINKKWYITFITLSIFCIIIFFGLYFYFPNILIKLIGTSFFYRVDRIINFANGNSYQLENALINIGASSFFGVGFKKILLYIPEAPTDFIFAFSTSNFGILSAILILLSYLIIDIFLFYKINKINNNKNKIFSYTYLGILLFHEIYNISMNLGLLPIMGIPLPFLSLGGTNILINYIYLGFLLNFFGQKK